MGPRRAHPRPLIIVGIALAAALALAATNLHLALDADAVGRWMGPRATTALSRPVTVGEARLSLWPRPTVRVSDVRVANPPTFGGPVLAHVELLRFDVAWLPLLVGRISIRRVVVDGARLHLAVDEAGTTNFGDLVPASLAAAGDSLPRAVAIRVREIAVRSGSLSYFDAQADKSFMVTGARADASLAPDDEGGWRAVVSARSDSLLVRVANDTASIFRAAGPSGDLVLRGGDGTQGVRFEDGVLALAGDTLGVRGGLSYGGERPSFEVHLGNDALAGDVLVGWLSTQLRSRLLPRLEGRLGASFQLTGRADEAPVLRGGLHLDDVTLRLRGEPVAERLRGVVSITKETISVDSLSGQLAGGPMDLAGTLDRRARVASWVAHLQPDLDLLERLGLLPAGVRLSGSVTVQASLAGPLDAPDSTEVVGSLAFDGVRLEHPRLGVPVYVPVGEVALLGREARWLELTALVGEDRVVTTGTLRRIGDLWPGTLGAPEVELSLAGQHLDLATVLRHRQPMAASYTQVAIAHLGGRAIDGQTAAVAAAERRLSRPLRLPILGVVEVHLDTLRYHRHALDSVAARLELTDSSLVVTEATFGAWGGRATGSLHLGVGEAPSAPFALALTLAGVDGQAFLAAMSPLGTAASGTLDLDLEIGGATDRSLLPYAEGLGGRLDIDLTDGRIGGTGLNHALADFLDAEEWSDVAFTRWSVQSRIVDGAVDVQEASLTAEPGDVVFRGPVRFDGAADLAMAVTIPADRLEGISLRRTGIGQGVLDRLRAAGSPLDLGLRMSGWIQAPTLEPDAASAPTVARRSP